LETAYINYKQFISSCLYVCLKKNYSLISRALLNTDE